MVAQKSYRQSESVQNSSVVLQMDRHCGSFQLWVLLQADSTNRGRSASAAHQSLAVTCLAVALAMKVVIDQCFDVVAPLVIDSHGSRSP